MGIYNIHQLTLSGFPNHPWIASVLYFGQREERTMMRFGLCQHAVLALLCALLAGCSKPQTSQQSFTRELSPGKILSIGELMSQAENARSPDEKLALFQQIVAAYPDSPQVAVAQFMVGFVLYEEMHRPEDAKVAFQALKEKHPSSEWIDDADKLLAEMAQSSPAPSE